jgi:hypothetical protein
MTTPCQLRTFAYAGSVGDTFDIDLPSGFGAALGQQSYQLRKETGKNIRIRRNRTDTGYAYGYTAYIRPKEIEMAKIADKLTKVNESFTINMYDNGYMVEVGGRNDEDNWINTKIICADLDQVIELVREAADMPRND